MREKTSTIPLAQAGAPSLIRNVALFFHSVQAVERAHRLDFGGWAAHIDEVVGIAVGSE
jgi:hypothetical protein